MAQFLQKRDWATFYLFKLIIYIKIIMRNFMSPLIADLENIGLSEKEARVYLAALELAGASVQNIAKKAGVNRATTYVILESLIKKGLCSSYEQAKKTFYAASTPDSLESIFELQKKQIEERQKLFEKLLPDLRTLHNRETDKPVVRFFEGKQGLLSCEDEFLTSATGQSKEEVRFVYPKDRLDEIFTDSERQKYREIRMKRKIKSRALYTYKAGDLKSTADGTRIKLESDKFPVTSDIAIYDDNIRILSLGKRLSAVLIKDHEIAKTLKSVFDLAWEAAQTRSKK